MNQEQLQAIRERVNKATPGPWYLSYEDGVVDGLNKYVDSGHDAEFVCHAREDVSALLDEIEQQKQAYQRSEDDAYKWFHKLLAAERKIERLRSLLMNLDAHLDFSTPFDDGVCVECGLGWEDASGLNKAMEEARQALAGESE